MAAEARELKMGRASVAGPGATGVGGGREKVTQARGAWERRSDGETDVGAE